jgi:phosphoadenosine phosphosulfate reductase
MAPLDAAARTIEPEDGPRVFDPEHDASDQAAALNARYSHLDTPAVIAASLAMFPGKITSVSSFGAESAVFLHHLALVDQNAPVIFIDSGRLFPETLAYRDELIEFLGLTDVRTIGPPADRIDRLDPHRALWMTDPDLCCRIRKTEPLIRALDGFDAWFTGRKHFQSARRAALSIFEADGARVKVNPLLRWTTTDLASYSARHNLPAHPLAGRGYPSIGCVPCTTTVRPGEDQRAGRWRGRDKDECGIHLGLQVESDGSGI